LAMNSLGYESGLGFLVVHASSLRRFTFTVRPRVLSSRGALRPFFFLFLGLRAMRVLLAQVSRTAAFMSSLGGGRVRVFLLQYRAFLDRRWAKRELHCQP
jgi:hypothetical protein